MNFIDILNQSLDQDQAKYKNVVDIKKNNQIEFKKYNSDTFDQSSCCITMVDFTENDIVAVLPCKHCFNKEALIKWVTEESATCPICRFKLESTEVSTNGEEKQPDTSEQQTNNITDFNTNHLINSSNMDEFVNSFENIINNIPRNNNVIMELINLVDRHINDGLNTIENLNTGVNHDPELQQAILNSLT